MITLGGGDGKFLEVAIAGREGTMKVPFPSSLPVLDTMRFTRAARSDSPDELTELGYEIMCR